MARIEVVILFLSTLFLSNVCYANLPEKKTGQFLYDNCKANLSQTLESSYCYGYIEGSLYGYAAGGVTVLSSVWSIEAKRYSILEVIL